MLNNTPSTIVYSCTFADYDYTFGPLIRTPNTEFIRFGTTRPNRYRIWRHKELSKAQKKPTQTLTNRYFKLFPGRVIPECDVAIYIDGNILVRADLSPLIREFWESEADIALFQHPSGRTVEEEIDFALENNIPHRDAHLAEKQREKYRKLGLAECPITENTILFYRMSSPKIAEIGDLWWNEIEQYCKRDQISLPFVLDKVQPRILRWDWHFHHPARNNPYFARSSHRPKDRLTRLRSAAFFMKDYSIEHRALFSAIKLGGQIRNFLSAIRSKWSAFMRKKP